MVTERMSMPKKLFLELDKNKRDKITQVIINEFASHSYNESSTNAIAEKAQIAKGSLFKYFKNKEDMYFYILDYLIEDFTKGLSIELSSLPKDIFERTCKYAQIEFDWYIKNPIKYKLFKRAFNKTDAEIYAKTIQRYSADSEKMYYALFDDIQNEGIAHRQETLDILKWFLEGFNREFIDNITADSNMENIKSEYIAKLENYMSIIKNGLLQKEK